MSDLPSDPIPLPPPAAEAEPGDPVFEALHPYARYSIALGTLLGFSFLYVPLATVVLVAWDADSVGALGKFALFVVGFGLVAMGSWLYANARFRRARFALTEDGLRIRRGVFWQSELLVPRSRVQHTDLNRGPIDRQLGMASLKVFTAGTKLASVSLDGLPDARAVELRDALVSDDDDAV